MLETVIVDGYRDVGNVCLNRICKNSKALLHVAKVIEEAKALAEHGIVFGEPKTDIDKIRTWKEKVITQLTGGLAGMAKGRKVKVVNGLG
ncbi:dihydrolipoyl dehydrogenase, partial [Stenotrophomonas maltophilia]|nr:dihydrolipoyl dehydrogenase [Stenotrophomonas maltophilia]